MSNVNSLCLRTSWGVVHIYGPLLLQNLRSSTEPAHANAEASVSGHRLDSNGKSIQKVNKEEGIFLSQEKNGT